MIRFEGVESFDAPIAVVAKNLSDAGWLAASLPDSEVVSGTPDKSSWKVRPKFSFMSGTLDTAADVVNRSDDSVQYKIVSKGVGSSSGVTAKLSFKSVDEGNTEVSWSAEVTELGGLLKLVPRTLIQSAMKKIIDDVWPVIKGKMKV